jgi:hypothetical protein
VRFFKSKPKHHQVAVHDTRPMPDDPEPFEPYFVAICACGWLGETRQSSEEAFRDAHDHDTNVSEEIVRPVG